MIERSPSSAVRSTAVFLIWCGVVPATLVGCRPPEKAASGETSPGPPQTGPADTELAPPQDGSVTTAMPPEEVFKRALWRRPDPEDKILHAERREWSKDRAGGAERWQWFLAVEPGPALKAWLREQNPFSVHPVGNADAPEIKDAPAWFPSDNADCIVHTGGSTGSLVFLWSRKGNTLYVTGSGSGAQPGAPEPIPPAAAPPPASGGRLPQTPPPTSPMP